MPVRGPRKHEATACMPETRRQTIETRLREGPLRALIIARWFSMSVKTALDDLEHIRRGRCGAGSFLIDPAVCGVCGFVFRDRIRLDTPSRCPQCRGEDIVEPEFRIEDG